MYVYINLPMAAFVAADEKKKGLYSSPLSQYGSPSSI